MATLVALKSVLKFLGLDTQTTEDKNLELIINAVEAWVQTVYCKRTFASTDYKEKYSGNGENSIMLDNYPVITLDRLSIGHDELIRVKNTAAGAHASVSVTSTGVVLNKDGTKSTLLFADYATVALLITAINALTGWSATVSDTAYNSWPSTLLVEKFGLQCINNAEASLDMPDLAEWDFEVDPDTGIIHSPFGFEKGFRNIYVEYTAGYATIPKDLQLAVLILVKYVYQRRSEESFGVTSYSVSGISMSFEKEMPEQARQILNSYKKTLS